MIHYTAHIKFLLFAILFFGTAAEIFAAEGDLDSSFGSDGIVITDNGFSSESIRDLAVQPDGKIIATGNSFVGSTHQTTIVRYNSNGSIDSTFGTGGKVIIQSVFPSELALQPNGKIVFVGTSRLSTTGVATNSDFYIARLNSDGTFDTTFNGTGAVTLDLRGTGDSAQSVEIQPDGKILTGGSSARPAPDLRSDFAIIRFNADGSLDTTFDGDGKVFTMIPPTGESAGIADLAVQPDGKILAAGSVSVVDTPGDDPDRIFAVVRYNANGSLDTTFDGDGVANPRFLPAGSPGGTTTSVPTNIFARNDGKILVVGNASTCCAPFPKSQAALVRFNADGSFDTTFASGGKALISFPADFFSVGKASIQTDNKIVIAGSTGNIQQRFVAVARLTSDGALDLTFSGDGRTNIVPSLSNTTASTVALQPDGKIVTGGESIASFNSSSGGDFLLARFEASSCLANCFAARQRVTDFDGDGKTDLSVFRNGTWFINPSGANNPNSFYGAQFGLTTDKLTPADFDGDGKTDIAVWRENVNGSSGYFYILQSSTNTVRIAQFGQTGDDPRVVGDWDGDGKADLAVYRNGASAGAQSFFFYRPSSQPSVDFVTVYWGTAGDEAVRGDFDGDGRMDAAVFRASDGVWYVLQSSNSQVRYERWGLASDKRVAGDFDGDGKTDFAVYRDGLWAVLQSSNNQQRYERWGLSTDRLVAGDYDGDGRTDFAVWRAGVYYILQNSNSQAVYQYFGVSGDIPAASAFVR